MTVAYRPRARPRSTPRDTAPRAASAGAAVGWRVGLASAGTAAVANLGVLLTASSALGAEMVVRRTVDGPEMEIGVGTVLATTLVPVLSGTLVLLALHRRGPCVWRALALTGLAVGLLTTPLPFTMLAATGTKIALALMHLITGATWLVLVRAAARRVV